MSEKGQELYLSTADILLLCEDLLACGFAPFGIDALIVRGDKLLAPSAGWILKIEPVASESWAEYRDRCRDRTQSFVREHCRKGANAFTLVALDQGEWEEDRH